MRRAVFALLVTGCPGPAAGDHGLVDVVETFPDAAPIAPADECVVRTGRDPDTSNAHVAVCDALEYVPHPPAGGAHYSAWADFGAYDSPVPWGFLVHSLEHGAVVLVRSCDDCPEVEAAFAQIAAETDDPLCRTHPNGNRIITIYDPSVESPIAAVAWGHAYHATCLDVASLEAFVAAHYAQAPEDLCAAGVVAPGCR